MHPKTVSSNVLVCKCISFKAILQISLSLIQPRFMLPLAELGGGFYDQLKSISSGYANFDYEEGEMRPADLVRLDLLINGNPVDALARIVHR